MKSKRLFLAFVIITVIVFSGCEKDDNVTLVSIAVTTQPTKITYLVDEIFDPEGMVVTATYSDKSTKPVIVTASMLEYDFSSAGTDKDVIITFAEKGNTVTTSITGITVNALEVTLISIAVTKQPDKKVYVAGESFDPSGMVVTATYSDETTASVTITADMLLYNFWKARTDEIVLIIYEDKTATITDITVILFLGDGLSESTAYQISNSVQLARLADLVNSRNADYNDKYYKLTIDIDLSKYGSEWNNRKGWVPIGSGFDGFRGHFDGNKHKVSNLYINDKNLTNAGLFGLILGTVQNLGVYCDITGRSDVGGVVGNVYDGSSITNCYATGVVSGNYRVGGVAGNVYFSSITNCYARCVVSGDYYVGGVAGVVYGSSIISCYATGTVIGNNDFVGGLAGTVENGSILENCVAFNPNISCPYLNFGRIAGRDSRLSNNVAWDSMWVNGSAVISSDGSSLNGADITKTAIAADGSIGGRFTTNDGWTIENGKLPGFSTAVTLPEHLK